MTTTCSVGSPRIDGTRVGVRHVAALVIERAQAPAYTADQFDLPSAEVYEAPLYRYAHIDETWEFG